MRLRFFSPPKEEVGRQPHRYTDPLSLLAMGSQKPSTVKRPAITKPEGEHAVVTPDRVVAAYSLVFAGLLFSAGAIGDRFGRKGALQLGLTDGPKRQAATPN